MVKVVPLVGTWIETSCNGHHGPRNGVVPLVGTWIETSPCRQNPCTRRSFPSWERGLKHTGTVFALLDFGRSPRGNVD